MFTWSLLTGMDFNRVGSLNEPEQGLTERHSLIILACYEQGTVFHGKLPDNDFGDEWGGVSGIVFSGAWPHCATLRVGRYHNEIDQSFLSKHND